MKPTKKTHHTTTVRIPKDLYHLVQQRAKKNLRSVSRECITLIKQGLLNQEATNLIQAAKLFNDQAPSP